MKKFLQILILALLCGCNYNSADDYAAGDFAADAVANITISEVREFYRYGGVTTFRRDYTIEGIVTANDRTGNFYRTFIIEDATGAMEIMSGVYDLYPLYPEGRRIYVKLTGLTLGKYDGMYRIGLKAASGSGYDVDYFTTSQLIDTYVVRGNTEGELEPRTLEITDITESDVGRLVMIKELTLENGGNETWAVPAEDSWNGNPASKDIKAYDADSNEVSIYTSGYADFALETTPAGEVSITGIVMKRDNRFRLKMRDLNDVMVE